MTARPFACAFLSALILLSSAALAATADAPATRPAPPVIPDNTYLKMEELQKYFDDKQYEFVARQIGRIQLNKKVLDSYELSEILALKGEAYLQTGRFRTAAVDSFREASKSTKVELRIARYRILADLIDKNPTGKYSQKTIDGKPAPSGAAAPQPLVIADLDKRVDLFKVVYDDEFAAVEPVLKHAATSTMLKPLADAAVAAESLRYYELAATGEDTKTAATREAIGERAADLVSLAMEKNKGRVALIERSANNLDTYFEPIVDPSNRLVRQEVRQRKHGLSNADSNNLGGIAREADQAIAACTEFTKRLHLETKVLDTAGGQAAQISQYAKSVLNADYSTVYTVQPR